MRNLDFGFDVFTRRERDHEYRDWIAQDTVPLYETLGHVIESTNENTWQKW